MTDNQVRCTCDPNDLFDATRPVAVEGCPAHVARRAAQKQASTACHVADQCALDPNCLGYEPHSKLDPKGIW